MERVTLTWDGTKYVTAEKEWLDDWGYHFGRFDALIASGDMDRASRELAFSPEGGLQAYLQAHAPGLEKNSRRWAWPRFYLEQQRFYVNALAEAGGDGTTAPWYWFEFSPEGLISGLGKQSSPPPGRHSGQFAAEHYGRRANTAVQAIRRSL